MLADIRCDYQHSPAGAPSFVLELTQCLLLRSYREYERPYPHMTDVQESVTHIIVLRATGKESLHIITLRLHHSAHDLRANFPALHALHNKYARAASTACIPQT